MATERSKYSAKLRMHKTRLRIAAGYVILLIASHVSIRVAQNFRPAPASGAGQRFATVHEVGQGASGSREIRMAYRDSDPDSQRTPVVLVHGSPGSGEVLRTLASLLSPHFRVIVPDLPGFGASTRDLPDYSFRSHAHHLIELLDALNIRKAQLVGFSMGGGVVLSIARDAPQRVASIVMLSAIGVQEYELTGSYEMNHALHGAQVAALWMFQNGFPHFGLLWRIPFTIEYARNFYDSDQRPLRAVLEHYRGPLLIIHGTKDRNVPVAAAREHHRIVPQSELVEVEDNHFMAFRRPSVFIRPLIDFLERTR